MPYNVPNSPDVPIVDLAEPDAGDYLALGYRRTGVVSGGAVAQSGSPNMTVQVADAQIIIEGVPLTKTAGPVTLDASTANPRFDVIGWYASGGPVAIKGNPSSNPGMPVFDPSVFCMTATVYVSSGAISITTPYITQKQITTPVSLRNYYAADNDIIIESTTQMRPNAFRMLASGAMTWLSSTLASTAETVMDWLTTLQIRQTSATDKALILKAFGTGVKGNNIFEVQASGATAAIAGIDSVGRMFGLNLRLGTGSPEGVVMADKGALYINEDCADGNTALYVKTTNGANTGWEALGAFVPASQAVPVGSVIMWPGILGTDLLPTGFLYCDGSEQASATYPALSGWIGSPSGKFGTAAAGSFKLPDYRGKTLFGVDGVLAIQPGTNIGAAEVILAVEQMPEHMHDHVETMHAHPQRGAYAYAADHVYLPTYHLPINDGTGQGMNLDAPDDAHPASTGVEMLPKGGSQPISMFQPSQSTHFLMKT